MKQSSPHRFLVVDDHADNRRVASWLLQTAFPDAEVAEAATIEQLTDSLATQRIDCVLLDSAASDFRTMLPTLWMQSQVNRVPVVLLAGERHLVQHRLAAEQGIGYRLIKEDVSPRFVQHVIRTAIEVSVLKLMVDEQGRELERLHEEAAIAAARTAAPISAPISAPAELVHPAVMQPSAHSTTAHSAAAHSAAAHSAAAAASTSDVAIVDVRQLSTAHQSAGAGHDPAERSRLTPPPLITAATTVPGGEEDELARRMQEKLLPPGSPFIDGFEVAGISIAADATGGDFFDYPPMGDDLLCVAVGECSGRGIAPTMLITSLRAYLRVLASSTTDVSEIVSRANGLITEDIGDEEFLVTLMLAEIDRITRRIYYCSAGQQGHLIHRDGTADLLPSTGMPMGLQHDTIIPEGESLRLQVGEMLLLTSDGVQKMTSPAGEQFGIERMLNVVRENQHLPARMIVNFIHKAAVDFAGSNRQNDDLTVVLIKSEDR